MHCVIILKPWTSQRYALECTWATRFPTGNWEGARTRTMPRVPQTRGWHRRVVVQRSEHPGAAPAQDAGAGTCAENEHHLQCKGNSQW